MKRRTKLILIVAVLGCLGGIGAVLRKIVQEAIVPFPGAVVVLDDASWRARYIEDADTIGYLWANSDTILYRHKVARGYQIVRRRILSNGTASATETLPIVLKDEERIDSLSPDGITLCTWERNTNSDLFYRLVRTDDKEKTIRLRSEVSPWCWSPDSQSLFGIDGSTLALRIARIDTKTGAVTTTPLDTKEDFVLETMTPEGKLIGFDHNHNFQAVAKVVQWKIKEVKGRQVVTTTHQKRLGSADSNTYLAPDGKRILWCLHDEENSLWEKVQNKLFRKNIAPNVIHRFMVTDIDGKNERMIGAYPIEMQGVGELILRWTPDGKGVSFVHNGKLMYLAVP